MKPFSLSVILLMLLVAGCTTSQQPDIPEHIQGLENLTAYTADIEPTHSIDLVSVQTFGDIDEPLLGTIAGAVVDDQDRVLLWEGSIQSLRLHAFNPDGSYHSQIGRSGQGPGEYQLIGSVQIKAGKLFLRDLSSSRVNVYSDEDFSFIESIIPQQWGVMEHEIVDGFRFSEYYPQNDGNTLVNFTGSPTPENEPIPQKLLIVGSDGSMVGNNVIESSIANRFMHREGDGLFMLRMQFQGNIHQVLSDDDDIYLAPGADFLIERYDAEGNYKSAFYYPVSKALFDADSFFEGRYTFYNFDVRGEIESSIGLPETWPALDQLKVDDENRIWAAVIVEDQEMYEWWVLEESGELLAKFTLPRNQAIQDIKNGHLYTRETDEDTGLRTIEKYQIQLTEL